MYKRKDKDSGLVHTVDATPANVHDVTQISSLLTDEEDVVYGDSGYLGAGNREDAIVRNKSGRCLLYTSRGWMRPAPCQRGTVRKTTLRHSA